MSFDSELEKAKNLLPPVFTKADLAYYIQNKKAPYKYIERLVEKKYLNRIKKGIYSFHDIADRATIANHLVKKSYVSFETALAYYGLIPERVSVTMSVVVGSRHQLIKTTLGGFEYFNQNIKLYSQGMTLVDIDGISTLIATPEKAICDTLMRSKIHFQQIDLEKMEKLLTEGFRIELSDLQALRITEVKKIKNLYHSLGPMKLFEFLQEIR